MVRAVRLDVRRGLGFPRVIANTAVRRVVAVRAAGLPVLGQQVLDAGGEARKGTAQFARIALGCGKHGRGSRVQRLAETARVARGRGLHDTGRDLGRGLDGAWTDLGRHAPAWSAVTFSPMKLTAGMMSFGLKHAMMIVEMPISAGKNDSA